MAIVCLDTTWTVDFFRNNPEAIRKLQQLREEKAIIATTAVTVFETLYGFLLCGNQKKTQQAMQFFRALPFLFSLDFEAGCKAAELSADLARKGMAISEFDSLIAGSMLRNGCKAIVTSNIKDFHRIKEITIY